MFAPEDFFNNLDDSNKEKCWELLGEYGEDCEDPSIFVLNISEKSLQELDFADTEVIDFCDLGCWESLGGVLSKEELELHKEDFEGVATFIVLLYCNGKYVTSAQGD